LTVIPKAGRNILHFQGSGFAFDFLVTKVCLRRPGIVSFCDSEFAMKSSFSSVKAWQGRLASCCVLLTVFTAAAHAQTDCAAGDGVLGTDPPRDMSTQELILKFVAGENKGQAARQHYAYTQDVLVQTLTGTSVDGQFHEVTAVSYDDKGKRLENVAFAEQSTLRGIQLSAEDMDDIRVFMPWMLTSDQLPQYNVTYAGQQHVDDLDTYVFHVEPKKEEKNKRYFQGRVWVDNRDLQVVKLCGKSVPDVVPKKKNQPVDIRPMFVSYRQMVDGNWLPAYTRVDDTLHFRTESVHVREIVKFTGYKRTGSTSTASRP
jgi:hypothetical protein